MIERRNIGANLKPATMGTERRAKSAFSHPLACEPIDRAKATNPVQLDWAEARKIVMQICDGEPVHISIVVLDLRIGKLETYLKAAAKWPKVYAISTTMEATSLTESYVTRARVMLAEAKRIRGSLPETSEVRERMIRQAIAIAENGIENITIADTMQKSSPGLSVGCDKDGRIKVTYAFRVNSDGTIAGPKIKKPE